MYRLHNVGGGDKIAEIMSIKRNDDGTFLSQVLLSQQEQLSLGGHTSDIVLFTDKTSSVVATMSQRGKNSATKYFLIPRQLRKGLAFSSPVSCQKIEKLGKTLFVYVINDVLDKS